VKNHPPYWLDETPERLQDGDGQELNAVGGDIAPLRHLVNVSATSTPTQQTNKRIARLNVLACQLLSPVCGPVDNLT